MLQLDPPCQCHPEVHPKCLLSTKKLARKKQKMSKTAKKGDFVRQNSPLRKCFFFTFSPIHLVALSESFVLDPKTLIWESVFMEIWEEQYRPFTEFLAAKFVLKKCEKWRTLKQKISVTKVWKSKIWNDRFLAFSVPFIVVYSIFSLGGVFTEKFADQNHLFWKFSKK